MSARVFKDGKGSFEPVEIDAATAMVFAIDRVGREMDEKWGTGRLPTLVPVEWAERFGRQKAKTHHAVWSYEPDEIRKHGEAMIRAYEKLDQLATEAGHRPGPPDVWEFEIGGELILLCRDIARVGQVARDVRGGRKAQVWSLDEIASVITKYPELASAKDAFPGAEVESIRPVRDALRDAELDDPIPL